MGFIGAFTIFATIIPFLLGQIITIEIIEHQISHVTAITFGVIVTIDAIAKSTTRELSVITFM